MRLVVPLFVALFGLCFARQPSTPTSQYDGAPLKNFASLLSTLPKQGFAASGQQAAVRSPRVSHVSPFRHAAPSLALREQEANPFKNYDYAEESRKERRDVFMHDEWKRHRANERFFRNFGTLPESAVIRNLGVEIFSITSIAAFVVLANCLLGGYVDFDGVKQAAPLEWLGKLTGTISLPAMPFNVCSPALSLLLVFRTNVAYSRWNEARTLWGGVINICRNCARQANAYFPDDPRSRKARDIFVAQTGVFAKSLRSFLRGKEDDEVYRKELMELVKADLMTMAQLEGLMTAKNRPGFATQLMSQTLRRVDLDEEDLVLIDRSTSQLVDLMGACERIFKSPVPLVYTRHTARFLTVFLALLPLALWEVTGKSWNHITTIPAAAIITYLLFGVEELGIHCEEPFSILPMEAFCNGAIAATMDEMVENNDDESIDNMIPA